MPRLFVWDYHGTLCKGAEEACRIIIQNVLDNSGIKKSVGMHEITSLFGVPWGDFYRYFHPAATPDETAEMVEMSRKLTLEIAPRFVKPNDNVHHVLGEIKRRGDSNVIVSSTEPKMLRWFIELIEISHLVDHAVGIPDEIDKNGGNAVEHKVSSVRKFAENKFDSFVVIGDAETDVEIGKMLNARTLLFSKNHANTHADKVISDLTEVLEIYSQDTFQKQQNK